MLVVDDDPMARHLARVLLEQRGMTVTEARDGAEGRSFVDVAREPYQLVVTDLHMPNLDGEGLLAHVRDHGASGPSVIVLTGTADGAAEARLMDRGADDYVRKPIDPPRFVARVKAALGRRTS